MRMRKRQIEKSQWGERTTLGRMRQREKGENESIVGEGRTRGTGEEGGGREREAEERSMSRRARV